MDVKPIGSGTAAMAMFQYVGNYTIKFTMDTAFVFSALCAAIKILSENPPMDIDGNLDGYERSRQFLVKIVNKLIGKRELSSQQIASKLIGIPNHYTNRAFPKYYWSRMLREIAPEVYESNESNDEDSGEYNETDNSLPPRNEVDPNEDDSYVILTDKPTDSQNTQDPASPIRSSLFNDIFFRPNELSNVCAWDQMCRYSKEQLPRSKKQIKTYLRFKPGHPQYSSHCLKKIEESELPQIPVLKGYPIPRSDKDEQMNRYFVAMLVLFKPWSGNELNLLKPHELSWEDAFITWSNTLESKKHQCIMDNMQLLYESKDAKFDYSAMRRQRMAELTQNASSFAPSDENEGDQYDPEWENAMQSALDPDELSQQPYDELPQDVLNIIQATQKEGFYNQIVPLVLHDYYPTLGASTEATALDRETADNSIQQITKWKDDLLKE
ncbi:hypothetical protein K435DRAFT_867153 [Dendrothele bispora CBS 962.96]|uniref:Uncharacterized protein n=1 Tax=Dendrothele bispora (strain CBS 962.96) TaxID=1314807 RepID=A0A4S8LGE3_DENBC|nr:hypothetical protein K435DRAFT_867153 [Dendrothele bispora CBS 962.96]